MKRSSDLILCLFLFVPVCIFIFVLAVMIMIVDRFSPFFLQERVGKEGKMFVCYKLQTMKPTQNFHLTCDPEHDRRRVTKLGSFLRNHGWDESPQILNILLGHMSFIGPRPFTTKKISEIRGENGEGNKEEWKKRFNVRPGLSGWRQVNVRKNDSYNLAHDIQHHGCGQKIHILMKTLNIFFYGENENVSKDPIS